MRIDGHTISLPTSLKGADFMEHVLPPMPIPMYPMPTYPMPPMYPMFEYPDYTMMDYHKLRKAHRHCKKASKILKHMLKHHHRHYWDSAHWDSSSSSSYWRDSSSWSTATLWNCYPIIPI